MIKKSTILLTLSSGLLLYTSGFALAETKDGKGLPDCEGRKGRIEAHITQAKVWKQRHVERRQRIETKGNALIKKLKDKGIDTSKLENDLKEFQSKLKAIDSKFDTLINKLEELKGNICTYESRNELKTKIDELKTLREGLRTSIEDARNYWKTTIKVDIQSLREQLGKSGGTTEENNK